MSLSALQLQCLETNLRSTRFRAAASLADDAGPSPEALARQDANDVRSFIGQMPCSAAELVRAVEEATSALERSATLGSLAPQAADAKGLAAALARAYSDDRGTALRSVYARTIDALEARGVDPRGLKVVAMVCAGGLPFFQFGLGAPIEDAVAMHVRVACEHGCLFELIPCTFADFDHSIARLGAGAAGALTALLRRRDAGRGRLDGVMFACKGTLAAALAVRAYSAAGTPPARVALLGLGTDLSQGFFDLPSDDPTWSAIGPLRVLNSASDSSVGAEGRAGLEALISRLRGDRPDARAACEWLAFDDDAAEFARADHGWYPQAFSRVKPAAEPIRARVLASFADAVGATPADAEFASVEATTARAKAARIRSVLRAATARAPGSIRAQLAGFDAHSLRPTTTKVTTLNAWVRGHESFSPQ